MFRLKFIPFALSVLLIMQSIIVLPLSAEETPTLQVAYSPKLNMALDGSIAQWNCVPLKTVNTPVSFSVDKSGNRHYAKVRLAMDDNYVYIYADIVDPFPFINKEMNWNGDVIEVYLGDDLNKHNTYSANDRHYFLAVGGGAENPECKVLNGSLASVIGAEGKLFKTELGYIIEGKIPVSDLGWKPAMNKKIRLFYQLGNSDLAARTDAFVPYATDPDGNAWQDAGVWVNAQITKYTGTTCRTSGLIKNNWVWSITKNDLPGDKAKISFTAKAGVETATLANSYRITLINGKKTTTIKPVMDSETIIKDDKGILRATWSTNKLKLKPGYIIKITSSTESLVNSIRDITLSESDMNFIVADFCPITPPKLPPLPGKFTQLTPENDQKDITGLVQFSWEKSANAESYTLLVGDNKEMTNILLKQNVGLVEQYMPAQAVAPGMTYYWKIVASNITGDTAAANGVSSFTTAIPPEEEPIFGNDLIYVDPSAATNGSGTELSPYNTWSSVTFIAGNSYFQKCGTTSNVGFTISTKATLEYPILIDKYGSGNNPIITSTANLTGSYVTIQNFEFKSRGYVTIQNAGNHITVKNNKFSDSTVCIWMGSATGTSCNNNIIEYNDLSDADSSCISADGTKATSGNENIIRNNIIHDSHVDGMNFGGIEYFIIEKNTVYNIGNTTSPGASGIHFGGNGDFNGPESNNNIVRYNVVIACKEPAYYDGNGIQADFNTNGLNVYQNFFYLNEGAAFNAYGDPNNITFDNNACLDNMKDSSATHVFLSQVYLIGENGGTHYVTNSIMKNNLVIGNSNGAGIEIKNNDGALHGNQSFENYIYQCKAGQYIWNWQGTNGNDNAWNGYTSGDGDDITSGIINKMTSVANKTAPYDYEFGVTYPILSAPSYTIEGTLRTIMGWSAADGLVYQ